MSIQSTKQAVGRLSAISGLLACPACGGRLHIDSEASASVECSGCRRQYPVRNGVPILLPDSMQEPGVGAVSADDPVSRHPYSPAALEIIHQTPDGWVLDLGAGGKLQRWDNVIQVDIFRYPMTDVVATADRLPFRDNAFKAVISQAVFEHLQYPEWAASEIRRVLQPGGVVKVDTAFLQPEHGYPHHFYNASETGLRHWFRDFDIRWSGVEAYQHPKWSLSWFLGIYLDRLAEERAQLLRGTTVGHLLQVLERSGNGEQNLADTPVLDALDALPRHELRTLAAGVSVHAINPPKDVSMSVGASLDAGDHIVEDHRKLIAAREENARLLHAAAVMRERQIIAIDRGNYFAQFHPGFGTLEQLGLRAWLQFKMAAVLRVVLPKSLWFRLRSAIKSPDLAVARLVSQRDRPFVTVVTEPDNATALVNTFFSLVRQTYSGWEMVLLETSTQNASVRRVMADISRLDARIRITSSAGGNSVAEKLKSAPCQGEYLVWMPEGATLAFEAMGRMVGLVRDRPQTQVIKADYASYSLCGEGVRCYNQLVPEQPVNSGGDAMVVQTAASLAATGAAVDEDALAYIPDVLFYLNEVDR